MDIENTDLLIIVGAPRSGTTLLHNLLNNHPSICMPNHESHFIPKLFKYYNRNKHLNKNKFNRSIISFIKKTTFFKNHNNKNNDIRILDNLLDNYDKLITFEVLVKLILISFSNNRSNKFKYVGDKTPNYINNLELFDEEIKNKKVIILIRDPRKVVESSKNYWNMNYQYVAYKWAKSYNALLNSNIIKKCNYKLIKYEDLVNSPEMVLRQLCDFLQIEYLKVLLSLETPAARVGIGANKTEIVKSNHDFSNLDIDVVKKIEEICFPSMRQFYEVRYATRYKSLKIYEIWFYKINSIIRFWMNNYNKKNLIDSLIYVIKRFFEHK